MAKAITLVRATWIPASDAAISSSRTARKARPYRLHRRLATSTMTTRATAIWICVSHSSALSEPGAVGTVVVNPWSPPKVAGHLSATDGTASAKSSVMPARYGPFRRVAGRPITRPAAAATPAAAASSRMKLLCVWFISSAIV